ncbi:hypothetical protein CR513_37701, partial [Mucuna pruriens]
MTPFKFRGKSYIDKRRKTLEFEEGDHVFLRITITTRVGDKIQEIHPKFNGPYRILLRIDLLYTK